MRVWVAISMILVTTGLSWAAVEWLPTTLYFPAVKAGTPDSIEIEFHGTGLRSATECLQKAGSLAGPLRGNAPGMTVSIQCDRGLDEPVRKALSKTPLSLPSARLADGTVVTYRSATPALALAVCQQSEAASAASARRVRCIPSGQTRE